MATRVVVNKSDIDNIVDAVNEKTGTSDKMKIYEIATAIQEIPTGSGGSDNSLNDFIANRNSTSYLAYGSSNADFSSIDPNLTKDIENFSNLAYGSKYCKFPVFNSSNATNFKNMCNCGSISHTNCNVTDANLMKMDFRNAKSADYLFHYTEIVGDEDVEMIFDNLTSQNYLFTYNYYYEKSLKISIKYEKFSTFDFLFEGCGEKSTNYSANQRLWLDNSRLSSYNSRNRMSYVFASCPIAKTIVISNYIGYSTDYTQGIFNGCNSVTKIIILEAGYISIGSYSFNKCYHLTGTVDEKYNPNGDKDCYIYVPDAGVNGFKNATNWSVHADQIRGLSELSDEEKEEYGIA